MKEIKFNNRQNEKVTKDTIGDREIWVPRSPALVGIIILNHKGTKYVLMGERGIGTPDFQGYWNMPCGYLDWNESGTEGIYREVFEETMVDLKSLIESNTVLKNNLDQPWYVNHYQDSNKQNITLRFGVELDYLQEELPELSDKYSEPDEVGELMWIDVTKVDDLELVAFDHKQVLKNYLKL